MFFLYAILIHSDDIWQPAITHPAGAVWCLLVTPTTQPTGQSFTAKSRPNALPLARGPIWKHRSPHSHTLEYTNTLWQRHCHAAVKAGPSSGDNFPSKRHYSCTGQMSQQISGRLWKYDFPNDIFGYYPDTPSKCSGCIQVASGKEQLSRSAGDEHSNYLYSYGMVWHDRDSGPVCCRTDSGLARWLNKNDWQGFYVGRQFHPVPQADKRPAMTGTLVHNECSVSPQHCFTLKQTHIVISQLLSLVEPRKVITFLISWSV